MKDDYMRRILWLYLIVLNCSISNTYTDGLFKKFFGLDGLIGTTTGFFIGKFITKNSNYRYRLKVTSHKDKKYFRILSTVTGYGAGKLVGYLVNYYKPSSRLQRAKNFYNNTPSYDIFGKIESLTSDEFRRYVKDSNPRSSIALVEEFYWYENSINNLLHAENLLHSLQKSSLISKEILDQCVILLKKIPKEIDLLKKGHVDVKRWP